MKKRIFLLLCLNLLVLAALLSNIDYRKCRDFVRNSASFRHPSQVKIFMTYYKPYQLPAKGRIIEPIQVGRAIEKTPFQGGQLSNEDIKWLHDNMIGDDSGDNISAKNREFDVLTAYYWVWKHYKEIGNPQYIGFLAHRKMLILTPQEYRKFNRYAPDYGFDEDKLVAILEKHKVITYAWVPYIHKDGQNFESTVYGNYQFSHEAADLDEMVWVIGEKYPEMLEATSHVLYEVEPQPVWNFWVMEKTLALDYFTKLFEVMSEVEKRIGADIKSRDFEKRRAYGFLAERFFAIWLTWQKEQGKVNPYFVEMLYL